MEAKPVPEDSIPIPLNDAALAQQTRIKALNDEIADLQTRLGDMTAKAAKATRQAASAVKDGAEWADASAHAQLGAYPWAKLGGAVLATFVGTRLIRMLPFGGIASVAVPLVLSQIRQGNEKRRR